ncbi:MAG TPA: site-specific integrase [Candidatus Saccharimonadales bacterium]|jgi:integrase
MNNAEIITVKGYNRSKANEVFERLDIIDATKAEYQRRLTMFLDYVEAGGLTVNTLLNYKRLLGSREDLSVSSKNKYLTAARIFMRELHRQGVMPMDITPNVRNFRQGKYHKKDGLTDKEVELVQTWCYMHVGDVRDVVIVCLLFYQGLRQAEVCRLNWEDISWRSSVAWIRGKGRDDKEPIYLHPDVMIALKRMYIIEGMWKRPRGAIFRSKTCHSQQNRLTTRGLRHMVKEMFAEMYIEGKSAHSFRHYFVTQLLKAYGGDVTTVMQYTRHRSVQMLQVYNNRIIQQQDLPKFFQTFDSAKLVID